MALNYDGTGGLFTTQGKLIKHIDLQGADASNLAADQDEIVDALDAGDLDIVASGVGPQFDNWRAEYVARRNYLAGKMEQRLKDRTTVLLEIGATSDSLSEILAKLINQMNTDSESVNASAVTLGTVTAGGANVGNGTFLTTKILDGVTSPGRGGGITFPPHLAYKGLDTELCVPAETMRLTCVQDSYSGGVVEGNETWLWEGKIPDVKFGVLGDGSGQIGTISGSNLLQNGDFETFSTTDTPDNWTIDAGTVTTHVQEESTEVYHGSSSLQFLGDGSEASIQVSQAFTTSTLKPNKGYLVSLYLKGDASITNGDFAALFTGTGYTEGSSEKVTVAAASIPTSFTRQSFFVNMPASIPSDFKLILRWNGTPTNAKNIYIDDVRVQPVQWGGGVGLAPVRGSTPFVIGDYFTFTVANTEGVIQRAYRRAFGVQLPSDSSASETIADSLAT